VPSKEIESYLTSKGVDEILAELSDEPKTFSELDESIGISPATLSKKLDKGVVLGILHEEIIRQEQLDGGIMKKKVYKIDENYSSWKEAISESDLLKNIRKRRTLEEKIEKEYSTLIENEFQKG
jgi:DNA-binding transcriptional regulator GbsR (MarR family)